MPNALLSRQSRFESLPKLHLKTEGRIKIPCNLTFHESLLINDFLKEIINEFKLIELGRRPKKEEPEDIKQLAIDLFGKGTKVVST